MTDPTLIATQVYRNGGLEPDRLVEAIARTAANNNIAVATVAAAWEAKGRFIRFMVAHEVLKDDETPHG